MNSIINMAKMVLTHSSNGRDELHIEFSWGNHFRNDQLEDSATDGRQMEITQDCAQRWEKF